MKLTGIIVACLAFIALLFIAYRQQRAMQAGLPPRIVCNTLAEAREQAGWAAYAILGTGSMAPYIPAAKPGQDPLSTIVALAKPSSAGFKAIRKGDLVVYRPNWFPGPVCHQAALKDEGGWIMSGLNNRESESFTRVGPEQFLAIIEKVYVW